MSGIIVVGEDEVTRAIIKRIIRYIGNLPIDPVIQPVRGSQLKNLLENYNRLAASRDIIILTDLDTIDCAPTLIRNWFTDKGISRHKNLTFRVAVTEGESWLLADRKGFATWLKIPIDLIPPPASQNPRKEPKEIEVRPHCKPSLFIMKNLASQSTDKEKCRMLTPREGARKGPQYNSCLLPFIEDKWNITAAIQCSSSLRRAIHEIKTRFPG
jgi:hypothetical protein